MGWQTYRCESCLLVLELGGYTAWDEAGVVYLDSIQLACAGCGTMHRLTEKDNLCQVTALRGPIRALRTRMLLDCMGEEHESWELAAEDEWQPVGQHPEGIGAVGQLPCSHCGRVGLMLTHEAFLYPNGYVRGAPRRERCPVCQCRMECIRVTST